VNRSSRAQQKKKMDHEHSGRSGRTAILCRKMEGRKKHQGGQGEGNPEGRGVTLMQKNFEQGKGRRTKNDSKKRGGRKKKQRRGGNVTKRQRENKTTDKEREMRWELKKKR